MTDPYLLTEDCGHVVNLLPSYSGGPWLETPPEDQQN